MNNKLTVDILEKVKKIVFEKILDRETFYAHHLEGYNYFIEKSIPEIFKHYHNYELFTDI